MKRSYILLVFLLAGLAAKAQTEPTAPASKKLQQLYVGFGGGYARAYAPAFRKNGILLCSNLTLAFSKSTFFRIGSNAARFSDNLEKYPEINYRGHDTPLHAVQTYYLSIGKRKQLGRSWLIMATAGLSYNQHLQPVNIRYAPNSGFWIFKTDQFKYEKITQNKPGVMIQAEMLWAEKLNYFGLNLGTFFSYIPEAAHGGVTLTLNPGLLSRK